MPLRRERSVASFPGKTRNPTIRRYRHDPTDYDRVTGMPGLSPPSPFKEAEIHLGLSSDTMRFKEVYSGVIASGACWLQHLTFGSRYSPRTASVHAQP